MTLTATEYKHIQLNERNVPIIAGTTLKVVELITSVQAYGWSPEELHQNYPHLTLSQIHSALEPIRKVTNTTTCSVNSLSAIFFTPSIESC